MNRVIFYTATTLNGFLADENNSLAWLFAVPADSPPDLKEFLDTISVTVSGSTTYEWVLREEHMLEQPDRWTEFFGDRPGFVFTTRSLPAPEGIDVRFVSGQVADALPQIRAAAGDKDIWLVGGGDLAGQFFDAGALDELFVSIAPATLTGGAPLLPRNIGPDRLRLLEVRPDGQFVHLRYSVDSAQPGKDEASPHEPGIQEPSTVAE